MPFRTGAAGTVAARAVIFISTEFQKTKDRSAEFIAGINQRVYEYIADLMLSVSGKHDLSVCGFMWMKR